MDLCSCGYPAGYSEEAICELISRSEQAWAVFQSSSSGFCHLGTEALLTQLSVLQIEDLSQQVHKAAAEKFKVPSEPSALVPELSPGPRVRPECEEQEEEDEEVRPRGSRHLDGCRGRGEG